MKGRNHAHGSLLCRWAAAAALVLLWLSIGVAHARVTDRYEERYWDVTGNRGDLRSRSGSPGGRSYSATPSGPAFGGAKATPFTPNKTQLNEMAKYKAWATPRNTAKALMNPGSAVITLVGGAAAGWLLQEACVRVFGGALKVTAGVEWEECIIGNTGEFEYRYAFSNSHGSWDTGWSASWASVADQACSFTLASGTAVDGLPRRHQPGYPCSSSSFTSGSTSLTGRVQAFWGGAWQGSDVFTIILQKRAAQGSTGAYRAISNQGAEDKLTEKLEQICWDNVNQTYCVKLLEELIEQGAQVEVTDSPLEGPESIDGGSSVSKSTDPNGVTKTETITKRYDCAYSDQSITCKVVTTTEKKTGDEPAETETKEDDDKRSACEKDPNALGCSGELDTPEVKLPKSTKEIIFAPESLGLGAGACPAPVAWHDSLGNHEISFGPICEATTTIIRPLLLLTAALMAIFIVAPLGGKD